MKLQGMFLQFQQSNQSLIQADQVQECLFLQYDLFKNKILNAEWEQKFIFSYCKLQL